MAPGIGASGVLGVAFETTPNTYIAPTKFIPFTSESLKYSQDTKWRRPIRNNASVIGAIAGNSHTEGDIEIESLLDCIIYFVYASRTAIAKSGTAPSILYTCTPTAQALPSTGRTLSITIVRNGIVFGYTGCTVGSFKFSVDDGTLKFTASIIGRDEATAGVPTPVWPTTAPFGAGMYSVQIPTATQVFDTDQFEFSVNDNASPQYRLKSTGTGAQFVNFGENAVTASMSRDFDARTEYDAYKALTAQTITFTATRGTDILSINVPVAIKESYETNLSSQGDLVRASVSYQGIIDGTGKTYTLLITCAESIT